MSLALSFADRASAAATPEWREHPEWSAYFAAESLSGTIAVYDERTEQREVYDLARAGLDPFGLDGALRISALEQIAFLRRLRHNELPFSREHQRLVKDVMIVDARREWILRGKTGWTTRAGASDLGWFVSWVERQEGSVYFALDVDMPRGLGDAPKRERIARAVLRRLDALPENE